MHGRDALGDGTSGGLGASLKEMNRLSAIAGDQRFRWCLALSAVLTTAGLSYLGLLLQPRSLRAPSAYVHTLRIAVLPPPPPKPFVVKHVAPKPVKKIPPRRVIVKRPIILKPRHRMTPKVRHLRATLHRASPRHNPLVAKRLAAPGGASSHAPALAATVVDPTLTMPTPATQRPVMMAKRSPISIPRAPPAPVDAPTLPAPPAPDNSGGSGSASGHGEGNGAGSGRGDGQGTGNGTGGGPFGIGSGGTGNGEGPRHVVYVLDISGSMTSRIDKARQELRDSLASLQPGETFDIITFSDTIHEFSNNMTPATPSTIQRASYFLSTLMVGGGTNLELALRDTLRLPDVNVVFVLTDGVPTMDANGDDINRNEYLRELPRLVSALNIHRARIYTIGLVGKDPDGRDESFAAAGMLQQIARDSGGVSKIVPLGVADPGE